jgi:hypothetical protein
VTQLSNFTERITLSTDDIDAMRDAVAMTAYARANDTDAVCTMIGLMTPEQRTALIGALLGLAVDLSYALDLARPGASDLALRKSAEMLASISDGVSVA